MVIVSINEATAFIAALVFSIQLNKMEVGKFFLSVLVIAKLGKERVCAFVILAFNQSICLIVFCFFFGVRYALVYIFPVFIVLAHTKGQKVFDLPVHRAKVFFGPCGNGVIELRRKPQRELLFLLIIHSINREYRNIDRPTDVISFAFLDNDDLPPIKGAPILLGDIYICKEIAIKQAEEYNHSLRRELAFLYTHGLLHLFGYDHVNNQDEEKLMFSLQDKILNKVNIKRSENNE